MVGCSVIVAFRSLSDDDELIRLARFDGDLVSAAKATLDALNRYVTMDPVPVSRRCRTRAMPLPPIIR